MDGGVRGREGGGGGAEKVISCLIRFGEGSKFEGVVDLN